MGSQFDHFKFYIDGCPREKFFDFIFGAVSCHFWPVFFSRGRIQRSDPLGMGSQFDLFQFYIDGCPGEKVILISILKRFLAIFDHFFFLSPVAASSFSDPLWGPNLISFSFILTNDGCPWEKFLGFQFCGDFLPILTTFFFIPFGGIQRSDPLCDPNLTSFSFISRDRIQRSNPLWGLNLISYSFILTGVLGKKVFWFQFSDGI